MSAVEAEARLRRRLDVPAFMTAFHVSFLLLSLIGLFLITIRVVPFDFDASLAVVVAVLLNVVFAFLGAGQMGKKTVQKQALPVLPVPARAERLSSMVSFVITAHDDELRIGRCIDGVFRAAVGYRGTSEVIVVDDGSSDGTYEAAWAAVGSKKQELSNIPARVVKHLTCLGAVESARTGVGKASGEYVALIDAKAVCDVVQLSGIVGRVFPAPKTVGDLQSNSGLYSVEGLRRLFY